jgi:hypothetical protein
MVPVNAQETWVPVKSNARVTVFTKTLPEQPYKSFKAVGHVNASLAAVLAVLGDVSQYNQWFAYSQSVRLLDATLNEKHVYMETNFPWPFRNEDMVYKISVSKKAEGEVLLTLTGLPEFIPPLNGINRMTSASGYIHLQKESEFTRITYEMHMELSGGIPPWLANKNIHLMPFQTLENLMNVSKTDLNPNRH